MLELTQLNVCYGDAQVLWDVSLTVQEGETIALIGANGAGKTTTLRAISGLLHPISGTVTFKGTRIERLPAHRIAELGICHVPEGRALFPEMTVRENLRLGAYARRARQGRDARLERVFELFPVLRERQGQSAGTLSGGEQQMLAIGRGLMGDPRLLLLDEPSLGLAPLIASSIFETLRRITREGLTVLLVEQNVPAALALADRGYVLENGRITLEGRGEDLLRDERVKAAYLTV